MGKPKVGFYWFASCGGCEESQVDIADKLIDVVNAVDIAIWPVALDFKDSDLEKLEDGELVACFLNGAITNSEHRKIAELFRKKSKYVIAYGACSYMGGIPGLEVSKDKESLIERVYLKGDIVVNPDKVVPVQEFKEDGVRIEIPEIYERPYSLDEVIDVDFYVPGCPPTPNVFLDAVNTLLSGKIPEKGYVFGSRKSLCNECPLNKTKPEKVLVKEFKRPHEVILDPEKCYLAQGVICLGPVTRGGCDSLCIKGGMPCTGCFGPLEGIKDYGAKAISYIASILDSKDLDEIRKTLEKIPDPLGTFYRYSLPRSLFYKKRVGDKK